MAELTVHLTLTFKVVEDSTLVQPHRTSDAADRAAKAIELKDKPGVIMTRITLSTASEGA
jgi:hypothetical protein